MEGRATIVILVHPGTETLVRSIWEKMCSEPLWVLPFQEGTDIQSLLEDLVADNEVAQRFVLVPANLVPVVPVSLGELQASFVDVQGNDRRYWGRTPVTFDKEVLADFLPDHAELDDEAFVRKYVETCNGRPHEVSHGFGNFMTKVLRGNPCENVVIEAFIRKRFVFANPEGWTAITGLLEKLL